MLMMKNAAGLVVPSPYIDIAGRHVAYRIIRTGRRKSVGIEICPIKGLMVRVPVQMSRRRVRNILRDNAGWIGKRLDFLHARLGVRGRRRFNAEERLYFLGECFTLNFFSTPPGRGAEVVKKNGILAVGASIDISAPDYGNVIRAALIDWYRGQAGKILRERVAVYAPRVGVAPPPVRISDARRRWGSCGSRGRLNFSWRVVMASLPVVDYVVVHELCHLLRRDHSSEFWRLVQAVLPDYRVCCRHLRTEGFFYDF